MCTFNEHNDFDKKYYLQYVYLALQTVKMVISQKTFE